jgi:hypothetical protein
MRRLSINETFILGWAKENNSALNSPMLPDYDLPVPAPLRPKAPAVLR